MSAPTERIKFHRLYDGDDQHSEDFHRFGHVLISDQCFNPLEQRTWDQRFPPVRPKPPLRQHSYPSKSASYQTYLIGVEGSHMVKIGTAKIPEARMATLQTGQPMTLTLLWTHERDVERALHKRFAAHRVRGEWFDLTPLGDSVDVVTAAAEEIKAAEQ